MSNGVTNSESLTIPRELWERSVLASHPIHESYPLSLIAYWFTLFHFIPTTSDVHWLPILRYPSRRDTSIYPSTSDASLRCNFHDDSKWSLLRALDQTRHGRYVEFFTHSLSEIIKIKRVCTCACTDRHARTSITRSRIILKWRNVLSTYSVSV